MSGATSEDALRDLARRAGIAVEWRDYANREHVVASDVLRRLLAALGLPADTRSDLAGSRRLLGRRTSLASLPPMVTATAGRPTRLDVGASESRSALLKLESGGTRDLTLIPARGRLRVPPVLETRLSPDGNRRSGDRARRRARAAATRSTMPCRMRGFGVWPRRCTGCGIPATAASATPPGSRRWPRRRRRAAPMRWRSARCTPCTAPMLERFGPYSPSSRLFLNPLHAAPALVFGTERVAAAIAEAGLGAGFCPAGAARR